VKLLVPLIMQSLYSKDDHQVRTMQSCLQHLASFEPYVIMGSVLKRVYPALDPSNTSCTHQAPSALMALAAVTRPLLYPRPLLAPHLPQLLTLTLSGIDANDAKKTMIAFSFIQTLLACVSLVDETTSGDSPSIDGGSLPKVPSYLHEASR
jgi:hypothetical protein